MRIAGLQVIVLVVSVLLLNQNLLAEPTTRPTDFTKGKWSLTLDGAYDGEFYPNDHISFAIGELGLNYYLWDNLSVGAMISGYAVDNDGPGAQAADLSLVLRHHFYNRDRLSLYTDFLGGMFEADERVPHRGTYFNFTIRTGIGAMYRIKDNFYVLGGARYLHLSNAALEGVNKNPDINSVEGYAGFLFLF